MLRKGACLMRCLPSAGSLSNALPKLELLDRALGGPLWVQEAAWARATSACRSVDRALI